MALATTKKQLLTKCLTSHPYRYFASSLYSCLSYIDQFINLTICPKGLLSRQTKTLFRLPRGLFLPVAYKTRHFPTSTDYQLPIKVIFSCP